MNLIWRFLWVMLFSKREKTLHFLDEGVTSFRVLPTDVDLLWHMNNGRYFSFMDLVRINLMIRCSIADKLRRQHVYPVIASEMIRFKKSIHLWKKFQVKTNIIGWDDKFFYVVHHVINQGNVCALSLIKARMIKKNKGSLSPREVIAILNLELTSPPLPAWVSSWQEADKAFHDEVFSE